MEMLIPILLLLFLLGLAARFLLGKRIYEHVTEHFAYDFLRWLFCLPFKIIGALFKLMKL